MELVDMPDLGSGAEKHKSSSLLWGTKTKTMKYKKLYGKEELDLIPYVKDYLNENHNVEILIGCDSQNQGEHTTYAVVVALYRSGRERMFYIEDGKLKESMLGM